MPPYVIIIAAIVQIVLLIVSLVVLARTPAKRICYFPKTAWVVIVIVVSFIGPIVFLTTGFSRTETVDYHEDSQESATDIVNKIYANDSSHSSRQE